MNNVLEGGINFPIRHLLNCHRGTNFTGKQKIVEIYLLKRSVFWNKISMLLNSENQLFLQHYSLFHYLVITLGYITFISKSPVASKVLIILFANDNDGAYTYVT